ncbi:MAG: aminopeptidase N [Desulfobulbaceae bacterium]|nr:aminopeptidase N [Desulfobulbaceae bacterium]
MAVAQKQTVYLKDYTPPDFSVDTVALRFELGEEWSEVRATLALRRHADAGAPPLVLAGHSLELMGLRLDGRELTAAQYRVEEEQLVIPAVPDCFLLEIHTRLKPQENTRLEGLYRSGGNFCTQCEAEGFRKITYYLDRPDVMARYTTTVVADQKSCPVLLANGNLVESGTLPEGRHFAIWEDPFPKPAYLFALVAGDLGLVADRFVTRSGREVRLEIYVQHHNLDKCGHAMASLKKAMRWDEEVFGLEYDLDRYMIVAVDDFNMGAMENKGLNIFNSKYILARPETATDDDYEGIERVVAHEYFHNWTGNRVTCRDWFQLSLKEGLTVFRDQQFSADMGSKSVQRISDVATLRSRQFPEDSGPMAHPVRPDSYIEINNFYTVTVYEKGAEVIRMLHTLLGEEGFRRGMECYIARHDGQAVTCDDFVAAMADANNVDLEQFKLWYSQAGTPELTVTSDHDPAAGLFSLTVTQRCPPTPGQPDKLPMYIPLAVGLVGGAGDDLPVTLAGEDAAGPATRVLAVREAHQVFRFTGLSARPVVSLLRNFSAPVKLGYDYTDEELRFLFAHDRDSFNRWEAGQRYASRVILGLIEDHGQGRPLRLAEGFVQAFGAVLADRTLADKTCLAQLLTLPGEEYLAEQMAVIDVDGIHAAREFVRRELARALRQELLALYHGCRDAVSYHHDQAAAGQRRLKNCCLAYLVTLGEAELQQLALAQFREADNMTDALGGLRLLAHTDNPYRGQALAAFYDQWQHDPLVLDKWFALQATAPLPSTLSAVRELLGHPAFSITNPNKVRALIGAFAGGNPVCFHAADGTGYCFLGQQVRRLDSLNPQVASRMAASLSRWRRYDGGRQGLMRQELEGLLALPNLSGDLYEVVAKSLGR